RLAREGIVAVPTSAYPTPARRPLNSRLDCSRLESTFGLRLPPWQQGVERMLQEIHPR
ncbi:MAG TPA: sugar nucleotide-binding protein, partial [Rubrivivax sp.]|nr:sugar nucleotide-binding protein [Rubrivivax sp.]